MLAHLCDEGRRRGLKAVKARVIPSQKNAPAQDVFERHGFAKISEGQTGITHWGLDLERNRVEWPAWFKYVS